MAIPDYETIMLPLLKFLDDQKEHSTHDAIDHLSNLFNLSEAERRQLLPSGRQTFVYNRVGWARTYLKKAGLLESPSRGYLRITVKGLEVLKGNPSKIDVKFLEQYPEFVAWKETRKTLADEGAWSAKETPEELLELGYQRIRRSLAEELLSLVKKSSPPFFEKIVVELLLKMGYGGSLRDAGEAIGRTGDEGIDGIIKEDRLGLDTIYVQAKRWEGTVGRPEIHKFVGALQGQRAKKGIFITTSSFSNDAKEYASRIDTKVVLIDGEKLAELMVDNDVGVSRLANYEIKKVDSDYFAEE